MDNTVELLGHYGSDEVIACKEGSFVDIKVIHFDVTNIFFLHYFVFVYMFTHYKTYV